MALALLLLLVAWTIAGDAHAQQEDAGAPNLQVIAPATSLPAKARVNVFLEVLNLGPSGARDLSIVVQPTGGEVVVVGQVERDLRNLPANDSALLVVRVATPEQSGGARLEITFRGLNDAGEPFTITRSVVIQIAPPVSSPLEVTSDVPRLAPGVPGVLNLTLSNPATRDITQLDVEVETISSESFIDRVGGDTDVAPGSASSLVVQGGTLEGGEVARVSVPVTTSLNAEDLQRFTVRVRYTFEGFEREQEFEFGARVIGDVRVRVLDAREVRTGAGLELAGTIVNTGTATAYNPRVTTTEESGLRTLIPQIIEDLEPNDAVTLRIPVERVADPEPGGSVLRIEWNDDYGEVTPTEVPATVTRAAPEEPGLLSRLWAGIPWSILVFVLVALGALAVVGLGVAGVARAVQTRKEQRSREAEEAEEEEAEEDEWDMSRKKRPRGKGKQRPKPG